ncbi:hypothetical protein [Meinhardsimonia xiamenensis]|nr:hypothetical protein [Meinhardsimonia xiamenensis]
MREAFASPELPGMDKVMKNWCILHERYSRIVDEGAFDFSEGANTSLFISAVNMIDEWISVAEHNVKRMASERRGRFDVYIASDDHDYVIEMKQIYKKVTPQTRTFPNVESGKFARAREQVESINLDDIFEDPQSVTPLFGGFIVPTCTEELMPPNRFYRTRAEELFDRLVRHCNENFDAFAVFAPDLKRGDLVYEDYHGEKLIRPMAALVLKKATN